MIYHISQFSPLEHSGGVAVFARDLALAIPDLVFLAHGHQQPPWEVAGQINAEWLTTKQIEPDSTVVADGYYGLGLAGNVERLIVVCHSTYIGWLRDNLMYPHSHLETQAAWLLAAAKAQERAYREADQLVSVSQSAQEELWDFYQLDSTLINNGIDLDVFQSSKAANGLIVEVAGKDINKGSDIIADLRAQSGNVISHLGHEGTLAERWAVPELVVIPSRHEGGPFAQLEAMASDKKIVASKSGFFKLIPNLDKYIWATEDLHWTVFDRLIEEALESDHKNPRAWVEEHASMDLFIDGWRNFMGVEDGGLEKD